MAELRGRTNVAIDLPLIRHMILNAIRSYKAKFGRTYGEMVIACDSRHYWRKDVFPHYKANRKKNRDASGFDWGSIFEALNIIKNELTEHFPYPVLEIKGAEADDIIASMVMWLQENECLETGALFTQPQPIMILSGDHDFQQLQRYANVEQYSPIEKKPIKIMGSPDEVLAAHIIQGDRGDGVPNILSPDDVFVSGGRQKAIRSVALEVWKTQKPEEFLTEREHLANHQRNTQLIDLSKVPAELQGEIVNEYQKLKQTKDGKPKPDLLNYFITHQMPNLVEHMGDF